MRVTSRGNLTVELIRANRFEVGRYEQAQAHCEPAQRCRPSSPQSDLSRRVDRVELSRESLSSDPWAMDHGQSAHGTKIDSGICNAASEVDESIDPQQRITPVVGSPALAGLGVALIVPGTLLDVVA